MTRFTKEKKREVNGSFTILTVIFRTYSIRVGLNSGCSTFDGLISRRWLFVFSDGCTEFKSKSRLGYALSRFVHYDFTVPCQHSSPVCERTLDRPLRGSHSFQERVWIPELRMSKWFFIVSIFYRLLDSTNEKKKKRIRK